MSHDRGAVTVGNEAPVWTSPAQPKSRMTTRSRHRLITGLLVNVTRQYSKFVQRRVDVNAAMGVALIRRTAELGQVRYRGSG